MKKYEKEVQQAFVKNEEQVIKELKEVYSKALEDISRKTQELQNQIYALQAELGMVEDADERYRLQSMIQSKVYQRDYQIALKTQVSSILDELQVNEFSTISEYLTKCYIEGFSGTMYSLQMQGIPLCFPLDQKAIIRALQLDSKISNGLYTRLGEDISKLKKQISSEISRGIANGLSYEKVAKQLADHSSIGYNNAVRITRTEGHRIQIQSGMDACQKAKERGAEIVKQWDSTLDGNTRPSHRMVDGEIRELDEKFSNDLMYPGDPSGGAAEVVNCRCALLQRARQTVDSSFTKRNNLTGELMDFSDSKDYEEFKKNFWAAANEMEE